MFTSYIISLGKPKDVIERLNMYNLNPILIRGVNGKCLTSRYIKNNTTSFYSRFGPKSSIGISLSHLKVWKHILKNDSKYSIVFEDDVVFEDNFKEELDKVIEHIPENFDILYLGCFGCQNNNNFLTYLHSCLYNLKDEIEVNSYIKIPKLFLATHAYILSKKGARKLLYYIQNKINNHIDEMILKLYIEQKIHVYTLINRLVYQTSSSNSCSANTTSYPMIMNNLLSRIEMDKMVNLNYFMTISFLRIGDFNINCITILFLLMSFLFYILKLDIKTIIIIFLSISSLDIINISNLNMIIVYYIILLFPKFLSIA